MFISFGFLLDRMKKRKVTKGRKYFYLIVILITVFLLSFTLLYSNRIDPLYQPAQDHIVILRDNVNVNVDGNNLNGKKVLPGDRIILTPENPNQIIDTRLTFNNLFGEQGNPITITNYNKGAVMLRISVRLDINNAYHVRFVGNNAPNEKYGIQLIGGEGIKINSFTSGIEMAYIKLSNIDGIAVKYINGQDLLSTIPGGAANYQKHRNAKIHDNLVINAGSEGLYIGNNYKNGDEIRMIDTEVYNNCVLNSGWNGIDIKAIDGGVVFNNLVDVAGITPDPTVVDSQRHALDIVQSANRIEAYNNIIYRAVLYGFLLATGDGNYNRGGNNIHDNVVADSGDQGMRVRFMEGDQVRNNLVIDSTNEDYLFNMDGGNPADITNNRNSNSGNINQLRAEALQRYNDLYAQICDPNANPIKCIDVDGDGYGIGCVLGPDCDDRLNGADGIPGNADDGRNINPGAFEICDANDNDCDALKNYFDACAFIHNVPAE